MEQAILNLLKRPDYTPLNAAELLTALRWPRQRRRELEHELHRLERNGQIARIKQGNRYALPLEADLVPGRIRLNRQGVGFVQPDEPKLPRFACPRMPPAPPCTGTTCWCDGMSPRVFGPTNAPARSPAA